jgi:hypothetical protein
MGGLIMGGYAKINKDKIQPSPALAAITGLLSGLNTRKKEMQDREDKQNKQAVDMFKYMQEQAIKERETVVKERGATSEEDRVMIEQDRVMTEQDRVMLEAKRIDQAQQTINDNLNKTALDYKKFHLDLMKSITDPTEKEKFEILQNNLQKGLEDYKESIAVKADERKNKLLVAGQISVETKRQKGDIASQTMIQTGQDRRNKEDNARMASEGALNRANQITVKGMDTGTESNDPKIKNFVSIQKSNQGFFGTVLTSPNKIVDDLTAKYMTDRSQMEMDAFNDLTPEQQKGLTAPVPVTMSKQAKGGWNILGWQTKIKAKPTQMLVGSDAINFKQFTTQGAKNSLKSEHPDKKEALDYLIGRGVSETAAKSIIDEVYK